MSDEKTLEIVITRPTSVRGKSVPAAPDKVQKYPVSDAMSLLAANKARLATDADKGDKGGKGDAEKNSSKAAD